MLLLTIPAALPSSTWLSRSPFSRCLLDHERSLPPFSALLSIPSLSTASYGSLARFKRLTRMHQASPNCILGVGGDYSDFQQLQTMVDAEMTAQYVANDGLSLSPKYVQAAVEAFGTGGLSWHMLARPLARLSLLCGGGGGSLALLEALRLPMLFHGDGR